MFLLCICHCVEASSTCLGSMQALYGKQNVDHACNINDQVPVTDKAKATSLPDILLVDFDPCQVGLNIKLKDDLLFNVFDAKTEIRQCKFPKSQFMGRRSGLNSNNVSSTGQ